MMGWKSFSVPLLLIALVLPALAAEPQADTAAVEHRVDGLLHQLTLAQKVDLIGGVDGFNIRAEPALGMPALAMSDGPYGVRMGGNGTAYAAGIALAASWDPALAQRVGTAMGRDARARGISFLLGPGVNIYRAPQNGRNMEYYGEDPYLAGRTAIGLIDGIQSQGVVAVVKHFAANNSEYDRRQINSVIAPRPLHEIYLRAFEMAVKQGHVGAVMSSYNQLNGQYTAEDRGLVTGILKHDWGFNGLYMSDWGAVDDGLKAFKAGLDLEMPAADKMQPALLLPALRDGTLSKTELDDKVRRILRTAVRFGFLDRPQRDLAQPLFDPANDQVALESARESLVLLKNSNDLLPLDAGKLKTIA
ncbi:MAG TPA: glycoside hydrolase family 3 N-terminal domain-containing protein, partial [Rhodanobacter sp.]|nr:glycoside hydrolase family 3 N-terminal domain-containing protein [Rhodanobacter sp.]